MALNKKAITLARVTVKIYFIVYNFSPLVKCFSTSMFQSCGQANKIPDKQCSNA